MPTLDPDHRTEVAPLTGDPPNPINPPSGCRFHPRCALAVPACDPRVPRAVLAGTVHAALCLVHELGSGDALAGPAASAALAGFAP